MPPKGSKKKRNTRSVPEETVRSSLDDEIQNSPTDHGSSKTISSGVKRTKFLEEGGENSNSGSQAVSLTFDKDQDDLDGDLVANSNQHSTETEASSLNVTNARRNLNQEFLPQPSTSTGTGLLSEEDMLNKLMGSATGRSKVQELFSQFGSTPPIPRTVMVQDFAVQRTPPQGPSIQCPREIGPTGIFLQNNNLAPVLPPTQASAGTVMSSPLPAQPNFSQETIYVSACEASKRNLRRDDMSRDRRFEVFNEVDNATSMFSNVSIPDSGFGQAVGANNQEVGNVPVGLLGPVLPPPPDRDTRRAAKERVDSLLTEAQRGRADILDPPGTQAISTLHAVDSLPHSSFASSRLYSSQADGMLIDHYTLISRVDRAVVKRIEAGEYTIDFAKLFPRNSINTDKSNKIQLFSEEGQTFFIPQGSEKTGVLIDSYDKWEAAYQVFMAIYLRQYPRRNLELLQYQHAIKKAASAFPWDRVYNYDQIFRRVQEEVPTKSWAVTYQEAFNQELLTAFRYPGSSDARTAVAAPNFVPDFKATKQPIPKRATLCILYNKSGRCKYGNSCRYEHQCLACGGPHPFINCGPRGKAKDKKERKSPKGKTNAYSSSR